MKKRHLTILIIVVALLLAARGLNLEMAVAAQQETNLLRNAGFEQPYVNGAADGWSTWHVETEKTDDQCLSGYHYTPKWNMETEASNVNDGIASQFIGNNWDTWGGGVYQTVDVTPGATYRFSFYAKSRASNDPSPAPSETAIAMNVRAAVDPNGGEYWNDSDIVWGPASSPHDNWQQFSAEVKATGDKMTVFTSANYGIPGVNQCRQYLDTWYDNAELVLISDAAPPAATPETQPSGQSSSGATICVNAFHDVNANGLHDPNEGYMPEVTFTVANQNAIIGSVISDGTENAKCFLNLEVGTYQVAQQVPAQYQMTSAANVAVEAPADSTVAVGFGSRVRGEPVTEASPGDSAAAGAPAAENNEQSGAITGPTSGGMICVNAFHDENANAAIDPNEGYMAGVTLAVASGDNVIGQVVSAGSDTPQCFDNLEPGPYEVTQQVSGPLEMTTSGSVMLAVSAGQAMQVEFGSRLQTDDSGTAPSETGEGDASAQAEEGTDDGGPDLLAIGGLAAIILGVILLGALIFFLLRR